MEEKLTKQLNIAIGVVFLIAAGILMFAAATRPTPADAPANEGSAATPETAETADLPEHAGLAGMKKLVVAENFESWTPEAKIDDARTKSFSAVVSGEIEKAYLLVKVNEGSNGLTKWDSYYFKLNNTGGHLFRPLSLGVPETKSTTLLFDLADLPYLPAVPYSEERTPEKADLLGLLKPGKTVLVTTFVSSLRPSTIEDASVYYSCKTGSECSLTAK